tara:strand:+ start:1817 stop:2020 length:204 start_codon:yes stop_codon:yes gene_type:complete
MTQRKERSELWKRIEESKTPEEVVEIMRGQVRHYGVMSVDQYRQPGHSKLMTARNRHWNTFWDAMDD